MSSHRRDREDSVEPDSEGAARLEQAREAFRLKRDSGTATAEDLEALLAEIGRFGERMGWNTPEVKEQLRTGRYRAAGFVILDEVGYDLALAKRSVGAGWSGLIDELFAFRDAHCPKARFVQVKEKFGALVAYIEGPRECFDRLSDFVDEVERRSEKICERCGSPGVLREGGWIRTLCDAHAEGRAPLSEKA